MPAHDPIARTYTSQGLTLSYWDWGNEGAPVLLLIHGNRDHARSWDWTAEKFRDRFHVIAPDLRGHGESDWSPDGAYLLAYHLIDMMELFDHLGAEKLSIVAHSFGGSVTTRIAAMYPGRFEKLVLVDGLGPNDNILANWVVQGEVKRTRDWIERRRDAEAALSRVMPSLEDATRRMAKANPALTPEQASHLARYGVKQHADGYGWAYDPRVAMFGPEDFSVDVWPFWRAITAPVLLCWGPGSWTLDPRTDGREAAFQDARTVVFEKAGHWIHHDAFDAFIRTLDAFL